MSKKTFSVGVWEEQSGFMEIEAETREEANKKAEEILNDTGITIDNTEVEHRAFNVI